VPTVTRETGMNTMSGYDSKAVVLDHPLVRHHLSRLRDRSTTSDEFRHHVNVLSTLTAVEATRSLPERTIAVETPIETTECNCISGRIALVPILRAGLGMVPAVTNLVPNAEVWHLGLYRDEATAEPVSYYNKLPGNNPPDLALVLDPMLATGGSAILAIETLVAWNVPRIAMVSIIAAPEGVDRLTARFPDVAIYTCAVDRGLNDKKFIVPGLGDAGDRIFNTVQ
jgi:uracil phosphoribosyltransferase